jgi:AbrB family looped-hinge helix DNA binding protein
MRNGTIATIDSAGRVVVPKAIREEAGLLPGTKLEVRIRDGCIELEPQPLEVHIERRDGLTLAVAEEAPRTLTAEDVRQTREALRRGKK